MSVFGLLPSPTICVDFSVDAAPPPPPVSDLRAMKRISEEDDSSDDDTRGGAMPSVAQQQQMQRRVLEHRRAGDRAKRGADAEAAEEVARSTNGEQGSTRGGGEEGTYLAGLMPLPTSSNLLLLHTFPTLSPPPWLR